MDVAKDFLPRVVETKHPNDKSLSYSGKGDFTKETPEISTIETPGQPSKIRTRASLNNSYT